MTYRQGQAKRLQVVTAHGRPALTDIPDQDLLHDLLAHMAQFPGLLAPRLINDVVHQVVMLRKGVFESREREAVQGATRGG